MNQTSAFNTLNATSRNRHRRTDFEVNNLLTTIRREDATPESSFENDVSFDDLENPFGSKNEGLDRNIKVEFSGLFWILYLMSSRRAVTIETLVLIFFCL